MYISVGFSGRRPRSALVTSRRDLDARKRACTRPYPKKAHALGLAPSIFLMVDARKACKGGSLATPKIIICRVFGEKRQQ